MCAVELTVRASDQYQVSVLTFVHSYQCTTACKNAFLVLPALNIEYDKTWLVLPAGST